jgi:hypothetical protein
MTAFAFDVTVPANEIISTALGTGPGNTFLSATDLGKAVTLAVTNTSSHVLAAAGAEIDGFITSVEPITVNNGFSFGGILIEGRIQATVGANQGATPMAPGDYVVADVQTAVGTLGLAQVKTGAPTKKLWRCISRVSGTGATGSTVVLERV